MSQPFDPNQPGQQPWGQHPPPFQGQPPQGYGPPPAAPVKKRRRWVPWVGGGLIGLLLGSVGSCGGDPATTTAAPAPTVTVTQPGAPAPTVTVTQPGKTVTEAAKPGPAAPTATVTVTAAAPKPSTAPKPPATTKPPATKQLTAAQENAVRAANNYLSFKAFSRKGLIQQLSSDAGDGYSKKDATFAVDSLNIDYKAQAAKAAKEYLAITSFSRKGLINQLSSSAGDGYTRAQAEYGVKKAGL